MKNIGQMLKQAQQMQAKMAEMQAQLADTTVDGVAGAGLVTVTLNGKGEMRGLKVDPSLIKPDEAEILEDLIVAAPPTPTPRPRPRPKPPKP
jgi:DNA-binding YbaB/EbfC family protein